MWSTKEYLSICHELGRHSLFSDWGPGTVIARGYADLGYEEFLLLSESKLLSLINGKISELTDEHRKLFFAVPSLNSLVDEIQRQFFDILELQYKDQREWVLRLQKANSRGQSSVTGETVEVALARGLMAIMSSK